MASRSLCAITLQTLVYSYMDTLHNALMIFIVIGWLGFLIANSDICTGGWMKDNMMTYLKQLWTPIWHNIYFYNFIIGFIPVIGKAEFSSTIVFSVTRSFRYLYTIIINVFTVTFDQFIESLLNKSIIFFWPQFFW